mmetsp:Transcript_106514/g.306226  ORF Transcript_106514/g.306226 Transcript_106514/m.306226 type:complete len:304 (+) Transcript_106514:52-963(+)
MALASTVHRTNWLLFEATAPHDRTNPDRPRRLVAPRSLAERRRAEAVRTARDILRGTAATPGGSAEHPDERHRSRWLLNDSTGDAMLTSRPNRGLRWRGAGAALTIYGEHPAYRESSVVANNSWDCLDLKSAFPEFSAIGSRSLQPGLVNRLVFEMSTESDVRSRIAQIGVLQLGNEASAPPHAAIMCRSDGDIVADGAAGLLQVVALGSQGTGLAHRMGDWCSGGPTWWQGVALVNRVMLQVDLGSGEVAISVDDWAEQPAIVRLPMMADAEGSLRAWFPAVVLTAIGQQARLIDFQVSSLC